MVMQNQISGEPTSVELFTKDGDGTDDLAYEMWGIGLPTVTASRTRFGFRWENSDQAYWIWTEHAGTVTAKNLYIFAGGTGNKGMFNIMGDGNVEIDDNHIMKFGTTNTDLQISSDGTNPVYSATGVHTFYNSTGLGTIRAGKYITGSYAPDISAESFLSKLDNIDTWKKEDGSINYSAHYGYVQTLEKDPNNCWEEDIKWCYQSSEKEECVELDPKNKTWIRSSREECGTKLVDGLDLEKRTGDMEGMISELKEENRLMKVSLCKLGEVQWC